MADGPDEATPSTRDRRRIVGGVVGAVIVLGVLALLVVGLTNKNQSSAIQDALAAGERPPAPDITLPVLQAADGVGPQGAQFPVSRLRGRVVVLNVWASWCPPCVDEAPLLENLARRHRAAGDDVVVLGLDTQDLTGDAMGFIRRYGMSYPSLRDGDGSAARRLETTGQPETYVLDRQGRIAVHIVGPVETAEELEVPLATLVRERAGGATP